MTAEGYSFSDDPTDRLCMGDTDRLFRRNRERFHRKVGEVLPLLCRVTAAFERGIAEVGPT